jgi:hypothetical protein
MILIPALVKLVGSLWRRHQASGQANAAVANAEPS